MNIKKVTIRGFKAFGDLVTCGDFSPGKNCVFGLNGSGKSTFVQAIMHHCQGVLGSLSSFWDWYAGAWIFLMKAYYQRHIVYWTMALL